MFLPSARECAGRPPKGDNVATLRLWERRTAVGDAAQVSKTFARRSDGLARSLGGLLESWLGCKGA